MSRLALIIVLFPCALHAQLPGFIYHSARNSYGIPEMAPPAYVLRDQVTLRAAPSTSADALAQLAAGTRLQLDSLVEGDTLEVDGVRSCWLQVSAGERKGYLWGGAIARQSFGSTADPAVKFVAGLEHYKCSAAGDLDISYRIVALRGGKEVDRIVVPSFAWGFVDVRNTGNMGLRTVDDVITLHVPCVGGCGCATGEVIVFWSGGRLHHAADAKGTPDGAYGGGTTFIYPADMEGVPDAIIRVTDYAGEEVPRFDEDGGPNGFLLSRGVRRERLVWNGSALVVSGPAEESHFQVVVE